MKLVFWFVNYALSCFLFKIWLLLGGVCRFERFLRRLLCGYAGLVMSNPSEDVYQLLADLLDALQSMKEHLRELVGTSVSLGLKIGAAV